VFAVANGTTIPCSLGRQYGPVHSLSFLDVYGFHKKDSNTKNQNGRKPKTPVTCTVNVL